MYRVTFERMLELDAPVERVWELVSHTNRLNHAVGVPEMESRQLGGEGTRLFHRMRFRAYRWLPGWRDYPFDWIKNQSLRTHREFESGWLTHWSNEMELHPHSTGTHLTIAGEIGVSQRWLRPFAGLLLKFALRRAARELERASRVQTAEVPLPASRPVSSDVDDKLNAYPILKETRGGHLLAQHLRQADDGEVVRMQPFALADRWGIDREEALRLFLRATHAGLLEMSWELLCPNCRVPKSSFKSLRDLQPKVHCEVCEIDFETKLDDFIELRFSVNPRVREAHAGIYCIGSPSNTPHVLAQAALKPGETRELVVQLPDETVRFRALRSPANASLGSDPARGRISVKAEFTNESWKISGRAFAPGPVTIQLHNASRLPATLALECLAWEKCAATAARVTSLQEFRSLFALEALPAGGQVGVRAVSLLFTDIKGSTQLYEEIGDAPAFTRVRKHFEFLETCIDRHHGAIVKTIGDAVMAVFSTPADAVRAGLAMQSGIAAFCREAGIRPALELKIGIHQGPAISFQGESNIDYFGGTVNIAARAQNQSEGGDVVITEAVFQAPQVEPLLENSPCQWRIFRSRLKGLRDELSLYRVTFKTASRRKAA